MTPTFAGEIQLAGWSESHNGGCKVTFWLQSADDLDAFRTLTVRKGNTAGHRMMAALVEIGDDEQPINPEAGIQASEKKPRAHMGDACYRTVMWCADGLFWAFLNDRYARDGSVTDAKEAADVVRRVCGITSRNELDTNNEANKVWHRLIREPYRLYLESRVARDANA